MFGLFLCFASVVTCIPMKKQWLLLFVPAVFPVLTLGQMSTLPAAQAIAELPGPPKNPPIFSQMTVILQGGLQFGDTTTIKGPVAEARRVDQPQSQNQSSESRVTTLEFDEQARLKKRINQDMFGTTTMTNVFRDGKLQSQTVDYQSTKHGNWQEWQQWSYDEHGRVSDFRAGRGKAEWNHYLNFKYDVDGRPLGYEYHDSKIGGPPTLTEISYSGNKVTLSRLGESRHKFFEQVQVLDEKGRVADLRISDLSGGELTLWYHVAFKYDDKSRVIEQQTDPFKLGSGDDYSPIPGKLIVHYDDEKSSGEQKFYDTDGKLLLHAAFQYDHEGIPTKLQIIDESGKKRTDSESFLNPETHKVESRPGTVEWEVAYDGHDNWTERKRWFTPVGGGDRILMRSIKQTITYR